MKIQTDYYNNIGIGVVSLAFVLNHLDKISISKACLIMPIVSYAELLQYLGRKTTNFQSIEKLMSEQIQYFTNFNNRYYDTLALSINSIQYLIDTEYISLKNGIIKNKKKLTFDAKLGTRAKAINKASENIAKFLTEPVGKLYLNLRINI